MTDIILCISKKGQKKRCSIVLYSILAFFLIFAFPIFPMVSSAKLVMLFIVFEILYFKNFKERIAMFVYQFKAFPQIYYLLFFYTIVVTVIACAIQQGRCLLFFSTELHYYIGYI